ncbi:hypothetical protein VSR82_40395, partial [Burkholderia sp. JPY481]
SSAPSATFHLPRQKPLTMQISLSLSLWHDASKTVSGKPGALHALTQEQLEGLVVGLPWQRIGPNGVIRVV